MSVEAAKGFWSASNLFLKARGVVSITLILVIITSIGSISECVQQKSAMPFIKTMGGKLLNHDTTLYVQAKQIEKEGGFDVVSKNPGNWWSKVKAFFSVVWKILMLLYEFWFIWTIAVLCYRLGEVIFGSDNKIGLVIFMLILMASFQIVTNFVIVDDGATEGYKMTTGEKLIPFKGVIQFCKIIPMLNEPIYRAVGYKPADIVQNDTIATNISQNISQPIQQDSGVVVV
jgi:hypothetical protein